jgi:hypothetical protein
MWEIKCFFGKFNINRKIFAMVGNLFRHGSRLTNFAGIMSQGLRIAPPEAPVVSHIYTYMSAPNLGSGENLKVEVDLFGFLFVSYHGAIALQVIQCRDGTDTGCQKSRPIKLKLE